MTLSKKLLIQTANFGTMGREKGRKSAFYIDLRHTYRAAARPFLVLVIRSKPIFLQKWRIFSKNFGEVFQNVEKFFKIWRSFSKCGEVYQSFWEVFKGFWEDIQRIWDWHQDWLLLIVLTSYLTRFSKWREAFHSFGGKYLKKIFKRVSMGIKSFEPQMTDSIIT